MNVGFNLVTDASGFLTGVNQASAAVEDLQNETKAFEAESKNAFKTSAGEVDRFTQEVEQSSKTTGKFVKEMNNLTNTNNVIKELKKQIREYTSEAFKAGEGTQKFRENLEKAGKLKDQLADLNKQVQSLNGNIGENFARAAGSSIALVSRGFEGISALQVLIGSNTKAFEQTLLRLQSLNALANVAREFAGIKDTITEIKLGFSGLFTGAQAGFKALFALIRANPLGAFLTVIGAITAGYVLLKDKMTAYFDSEREKLEKSIAGAKEYLGLLQQEAEFFVRRAEAQGRDVFAKEVEQLKEIRQALVGKIKDLNELYRIQGELSEEQKTLGKELEQQLAGVTDRLTLLRLNQQKKQIQALDETINTERELKIAAIRDDETREIAQARKKRDDNLKNAAEQLKFLFSEQETDAILKDRARLEENVFQRDVAAIRKKYADQRLQKQKELENALLELAKRAHTAELAGLKGEERIAKEREIQLADLQTLKDTIEKKGKATDANFKFTAEQLEQFNIIEQAIYKAETEALIDLQKERFDALNAQKKELNEENLAALDQSELTQIVNIQSVRRPAGITDEAFEETKQRKILDVQEEFAGRRLQLKLQSLAEEKALDEKGINDQLAQLGTANDATSNSKRTALKNDLDLLSKRYELEGEKIRTETQKIVNDINAKRDELNKQKPFSLAAFFGLTDAELRNAQKLVSEFGNVVNSIIDGQQAILDSQLKKNEEAIRAREKNITDLERKIDREQSLLDSGYANNLASLQEELEREQAAKEEAVRRDEELKEEKKRLARIQLTTDTIVQASNLSTAASQIYATVAKDAISTAVASAIVVAMFAAFAIQKANAFAAIDRGEGFRKGGYTGDGHPDDEAGVVHKSEFVTTAEDTKKYKQLLFGMHEKDDAKMKAGILELIRDRGIILTQDIPESLMLKRQIVREGSTNNYFVNENRPVIAELAAMNEKMLGLLKEQKTRVYTDINGNLVKQVGSHTVTILKKK